MYIPYELAHSRKKNELSTEMSLMILFIAISDSFLCKHCSNMLLYRIF